MNEQNTFAGVAALTICESLLLALNDRNILAESDIMGVLEDAASTHEKAADEGPDPVLHHNVATLIRAIIVGGNSVRRT